MLSEFDYYILLIWNAKQIFSNQRDAFPERLNIASTQTMRLKEESLGEVF